MLEQFDVRVGVRRAKGIKATVPLSNDLFWLLGLITAEGSVTKNPVEISQGRHELYRLHRVQEVIETVFGIDSKIYDRDRDFVLKVYCLVFWHLVHHVFEISGDARTKKVPRIVLSASREQISHFLQGEWEGDGWQQAPTWLSIATMSGQLVAGLLILFLISGAVANYHISKKGIHVIDLNRVTQPLQVSNKVSKRLDSIPGAGELLFAARRKLGIRAKVKGKHTKLYKDIMRWHLDINQPTREKLVEVARELEKHGECDEIALIKRLIESDLMWVKVRSVRKFQSQTTVYDFEVASKEKNYQNFVGGFGGVCLHNSHFLRNVGFTNVAILDRHVLAVLCAHKLIDEVPRSLTRRSYLKIEEKLRKFAQELNLSLGELDLYLWYMKTGDVLK